jgi:sarcosine oxidase subunit gamma
MGLLGMAPRRSPLHDAIAGYSPNWGELHAMQVAMHLPDAGSPKPIGLADASCLPRMGVKGSQAEAWLCSQGVAVPEGVNAWTRTDEGAIVARLARSEFFLEDKPGGATVERLRAALSPAPGVYPVLRQDAAITLDGERFNDLLVQTCNIDFKAWTLGQRVVVMTSMVGVSVLVLWHEQQGRPLFRIWCDGTFGPYLWETLLEIAREEGGGAVGFSTLFPDAPGS